MVEKEKDSNSANIFIQGLPSNVRVNDLVFVFLGNMDH